MEPIYANVLLHGAGNKITNAERQQKQNKHHVCFSVPTLRLLCLFISMPRTCNPLSPQSSKSIRSSGGAIGLVNDDMVRNKGKNAAATVKITFQTPSIGSGTRTDTDDADVSGCK